MRTGRVLSNPDAFAVDSGGQLTLDTVVAQIAGQGGRAVRPRRGRALEEPLSSFGLTSISVAELGAFIRMQFNYQVSALELMTTASSLSLAQDIIHGKKDVEEDDADAVTAGPEDTTLAGRQGARRTPSAFASPTRGPLPGWARRRVDLPGRTRNPLNPQCRPEFHITGRIDVTEISSTDTKVPPLVWDAAAAVPERRGHHAPVHSRACQAAATGRSRVSG